MASSSPDSDAARVATELAERPVAEKKEMQVDHSLLIGEMQLLLAERRTAFSQLRTGISVALVPLSISTVLVATSRLWNPFAVLWLFITVMVVAALLLALGVFLIVDGLLHSRAALRSLKKLRRTDTLLEGLLIDHDLHPSPRHHDGKG